MKTFKVGCNLTSCFSINIEAENEEEALDKACKILEHEGVPEDAKVFDRDYEATCAITLH